MSIVADGSDSSQVSSMISQIVNEFGKIDFLVSNAAIRPHDNFTELTLEDWERVRGVVLDGAFI